MKVEEVMELEGNNPVLCADGKFAMLLIFPNKSNLCGVQVHGEELHRWIPCEQLIDAGGGALKQAGAPDLHTTSSDMVQKLLALDWASRRAK